MLTETPSEVLRSVRTGLYSQIRTPARSAAARRPSASLEGLTSAAPLRTQTPPRNSGRVQQLAYAGGIQDVHLVPEPAQHPGVFVELGHLVRLQGDAEIAGGLVLGVDPEALEVLRQLVVVAPAQPLELLELVGKADMAVGEPVGQRGL